MKIELMRAHRALCSRFVDEDLFRRAFGTSRADLSPVVHYLRLPLSRRPPLSIYFDRDFYLAGNPDVRGAQIDPLLHFIESGIAEGRSPHPMVDLKFIAGQHGDALGNPPDLDALVDLLDEGALSPSPYFDAEDYLGQFTADAPARGFLGHFLIVGLSEGKRPNRYLDLAWYAAANADAPRDPYGALRHFIVVGDPEGRAAGPTFDGSQYWARYRDVADARVPPLLHFLGQGRTEGRQASRDRDSAVRAGGAIAAIGAPLPVAPEDLLADHADITARVQRMRQDQKHAVRVSAPKLMVSRRPATDAARLRFPRVEAPRLSVLIPVFNEMQLTVECLMAIQRALPSTPCEIIVADDASTDPDVARLEAVRGLNYLRQPANRGFIRTCNAAWASCRGDYVLLLNNDTQPLPGAIDRLVAALDEDRTLAAAGPKLLYPDGRLQEAGCYVRQNGTTGMVGLFADPAEGGYCHDRDVMYVSGAALLVRRAMVGETLFDEAYQPAYCEDVDLCLRLIAAGHRIRYVHAAEVVHHLSASSNRQSATRKLRTVARNQQILMERWGGLLRRLDTVRPIAFYLPQFHPTPENDLWWGAGFTEWANVTKARAAYSGHYQPHLPTDLGYYDLRSADALARQAALARRYGIEGFCVYYYNFGDRKVLTQPLDVVRARKDIDFRWCLCWANENWTRNWDGGTREVLLEQRYDDATLDSIIADAVAHAADTRYLRVHGRPLFLVYRPLQLPDARAFAQSCRAAFTHAGFDGVHLVYVESMEAVDRGIRPADLGFDACVEFPPHGRAVVSTHSVDVVQPGWTGYRYDYPESVLAFLRRDTVPYARYPATFPSWDNTPRQPERGTSFEFATPEAFAVYVAEKIEEARCFLMGDDRLLFINAWNEWAEGTHLEPDTGYGHRWLEALRGAIDAKRRG